jgi:hypothetical protein
MSGGPLKKFIVGNWYDSQKDLRRPTHNPAKGIAAWKEQIYIIVTYHGSRRMPYADRLDLTKGLLSYVGHGREGHHKRDHWNKLLLDAQTKMTPVRAFLDCGDLFHPKQLLYAGEWYVDRWRRSTEQNRRVFRFSLIPRSEQSLQQLRDVILYPKANEVFEDALRRFGKQRQSLYARFSSVLRAKDNIAGAIGEYWALAAFNRQCNGRPLIRCSTSFKDIDAIQSGTSNGFAIKTVSKFPTTSSSIWSSEFGTSQAHRVRPKKSRRRSGPIATINNFLIVILDDYLQPRFIGHLPARIAKQFSRPDLYQGSNKLHICEQMVRHPQMRVLHGNRVGL